VTLVEERQRVREVPQFDGRRVTRVTSDPGSGATPDRLPYVSVADGWVVLLHPLTPGTHTTAIDIDGEFPPGTPIEIHNITTIIVEPGVH